MHLKALYLETQKTYFSAYSRKNRHSSHSQHLVYDMGIIFLSVFVVK